VYRGSPAGAAVRVRARALRRPPPSLTSLILQSVRAPLPGPPAGSGRVCAAGCRGLHRPPARPGRGRTRRPRLSGPETRREHLAELRRL